MGIDTFPFLQNHTHLIEHNNTVYKLKLVYEGISPEKKIALSEIVSEASAHHQIEEVFRAALYDIERKQPPAPVQTEHFVIFPRTSNWSLGQKVRFKVGRRELHCHKEHILFKIICKVQSQDNSASPEQNSIVSSPRKRQQNSEGSSPNTSLTARKSSRKKSAKNHNSENGNVSSAHDRSNNQRENFNGDVIGTPRSGTINNDGSKSPRRTKSSLRKLARKDNSGRENFHRIVHVHSNKDLSSSDEECNNDFSIRRNTPQIAAIRARKTIQQRMEDDQGSQNPSNEILENEKNTSSGKKKVRSSNILGKRKSQKKARNRLMQSNEHAKNGKDQELHLNVGNKMLVKTFRNNLRNQLVRNKGSMFDKIYLEKATSHWLKSSVLGRFQNKSSHVFSSLNMDNMNGKQETDHRIGKKKQGSSDAMVSLSTDLVRKYRFLLNQKRCQRGSNSKSGGKKQNPLEHTTKANSFSKDKNISSDHRAHAKAPQQNDGFGMSDKDVVEICDDGSFIFESEAFEGDRASTVATRSQQNKKEKITMTALLGPVRRSPRKQQSGKGYDRNVVKLSSPAEKVRKVQSPHSETQAFTGSRQLLQHGRGRPKKVFSDGSCQLLQSGRGRPKKLHPVDSEGNSNSRSISCSHGKRAVAGVGECPACNIDESDNSTARSASPIKKRGRPKKHRDTDNDTKSGRIPYPESGFQNKEASVEDESNTSNSAYCNSSICSNSTNTSQKSSAKKPRILSVTGQSKANTRGISKVRGSIPKTLRSEFSASSTDESSTSNSSPVRPIRKRGRPVKHGNADNDTNSERISCPGGISKVRGSTSKTPSVSSHVNMITRHRAALSRFKNSRNYSTKKFGRGQGFTSNSRTRTKLSQSPRKVREINNLKSINSDSVKTNISQISRRPAASPSRTVRSSSAASIQSRRTESSSRTRQSRSANSVLSQRSSKRAINSQTMKSPQTLQEARRQLLDAKDGVWLFGGSGRRSATKQATGDSNHVSEPGNENLGTDCSGQTSDQRFSCPLSPIASLPCQEAWASKEWASETVQGAHTEYIRCPTQSRFWSVLNNFFGQ